MQFKLGTRGENFQIDNASGKGKIKNLQREVHLPVRHVTKDHAYFSAHYGSSPSLVGVMV